MGQVRKNSRGVIDGIRQAQANMPFDILQFHCDNGSEFLNNQLILFFSSSDKQRKKQIQLLRGRPYKKKRSVPCGAKKLYSCAAASWLCAY